MNLTINRQALFALLLIVLDIGYFVQSLSLPRIFEMGEPGPAFMPLILSIILFLSCFRILWQELTGTTLEDEEETGVNITPQSIGLVVSSAGFIWIFEPLGYWVATFIYTFVVAMLFEREQKKPISRSIFTVTIIALAITVIGWFFFKTLFALDLPAGEY